MDAAGRQLAAGIPDRGRELDCGLPAGRLVLNGCLEQARRVRDVDELQDAPAEPAAPFGAGDRLVTCRNDPDRRDALRRGDEHRPAAVSPSGRRAVRLLLGAPRRPEQLAVAIAVLGLVLENLALDLDPPQLAGTGPGGDHDVAHHRTVGADHRGLRLSLGAATVCTGAPPHSRLEEVGVAGLHERHVHRGVPVADLSRVQVREPPAPTVVYVFPVLIGEAVARCERPPVGSRTLVVHVAPTGRTPPSGAGARTAGRPVAVCRQVTRSSAGYGDRTDGACGPG